VLRGFRLGSHAVRNPRPRRPSACVDASAGGAIQEEWRVPVSGNSLRFGYRGRFWGLKGESVGIPYGSWW
jgi:hypothetical protein